MADKWDNFIEPLYRQEYEKLLEIAYRMTGSQELTQDLVQQTFLLAIFNQQDLYKHPNPKGWLLVTLRNLVKNEQRRTQYRDVSLNEAISVPTREIGISLEELLPNQLKESDRKILILRFEQQMSHKEIAKMLNISEDACRRRLYEAIVRCRKFLRQH